MSASPDHAPARPWYDLVVETAAVKGWSIADLGSRSGVARTTIYGWRANRGKPQSKSVNAVADVLGIPRERALRLAGVIAAEPQPPPSADPALPTPEEMERLREHIREVLGPGAAAVEDAIDRALDGRPRARGRGGAEGGRSERRPAI